MNIFDSMMLGKYPLADVFCDIFDTVCRVLMISLSPLSPYIENSCSPRVCSSNSAMYSLGTKNLQKTYTNICFLIPPYAKTRKKYHTISTL